MSFVSRYLCIFGLLALITAHCPGQTPAVSISPNSDATYQQLRNITLGGEAVSVFNLTLKRDAATFILHSGTVCFVPAVQGKVTGAVFTGDGNMTLEPPLPIENKMLKLLTKEDQFNERFSQMVLRFTDATYDEIKKAGSSASSGCDPGLLKDIQQALRHDRMLKYNLDGRILQDVLGTEPGGLFMAFIRGTRYNSKEIFAIDPHGAPPLIRSAEPPLAPWLAPPHAPSLAPEEVEFVTYDENRLGVWAAFHLKDEYKQGTASGTQKNAVFQIEHQQLDTTIEKSANIIGKATTTLASQVNGLRVLPFDLFPSLRVQSVALDGGSEVPFVQEDKNDDAEFYVILPKALAAGEKIVIVTTYSGKEAVSNEGGGNYFPVARDNWYPNNPNAAFGNFTSYDMTFRIPKGMKIAATGSLLNESNDGNQNITVWKSDMPQTVAGFNFGRFWMRETKLDKPEYTIQSYANEEPPSAIKALLSYVNDDVPDRWRRGSHSALGTMSTLPLIKKALAEGEVSIRLYTSFFGPISFKRVAMTQQTSCGFGQSWPALVWLPMCSFYDTTIRNQLGFGDDRGYWRSVSAHEVAHQWWGNTVGFNSYRDQWMSEGFAEMSASLFIELAEKDPKKFLQFWNDERELLLERNKEGYRAIDAGPVTLGYRLNNTKSGDITTRLIYPKGAYILHMIRMMMWNPRTGDQIFKETMQDFVKTYAGKSATTEDFKAIVEKHMTPDMLGIADGQPSMNWFFNQYVYGTSLPTYKFDYSFDSGPDGKVLFNFKLVQSGVDDNFRMPVPLYIELNDGRIVSIARIRMIGNTTEAEEKVELPLKEKPKRALINYYYDVLASPN